MQSSIGPHIPRCELWETHRFPNAVVGGRNARDERRRTVSSQRVLQQPRELRVPVGNVEVAARRGGLRHGLNCAAAAVAIAALCFSQRAPALLLEDLVLRRECANHLPVRV